jgi:purine-binding chemotaxis protein CheW
MRAVVTFNLGDQEYCLDVSAVREVIRMVAITPIPETPAEILGAIDVRGVAVLVLDLRRRFGLAPQTPTLNSPLLLIETRGTLLALLVDKVGSVIRTKADPDVTGLLHVNDRLTVMLNPEQLPTEQVLPLIVNS